MSFVETGQNNIYNKGYFSQSIFPSYDFKKNSLDAGVLWTFGGQREKNFAGYSLKATHGFTLLKQSFAISGFYLWEPFSTELREINWGVILTCDLPHFQLALGNNYRTYRFGKAYIPSNEVMSGKYRIVEPGNLIYLFQYLLNKKEEPWNLTISLTNNDYFIIEQETNPIVIVKGVYRINENIGSFLDLGYKSAGLLNLKVNHFGYFFRLGIKWNIKNRQDI